MTQYYWRVSAGYKKNFGDWSETWNFITNIGKVSLITPKNLSKGVPVHGLLNWNSLNGATQYWIQLSKDSNFVYPEINDSNLTKNEFSYNGLRNSEVYYWRIKANNNVSIANWSDVWHYEGIAYYVPINLIL